MNSYLNSKNMLSILVVASLMCISTAFIIPTETSYRNGVNAPSYQSELSMSSSIMESPRHSFEDRMRDLVIGGRKKKTVIEEKSKLLPANMKIVTSLSDYKKVVGGERDRIVVVRFFAPWCKACKAIRPHFYRLAGQFTNVLFVEVPVTEANANLHQGLGIPSLPFGHIYAPNGGLVEEVKITRPHFAKFAHKLQTYVKGRCELKDGEVTSPYEPKPETLSATTSS